MAFKTEAIKAIFKKLMYSDICFVICRGAATDVVTKKTIFNEYTKYNDIKCRLSTSTNEVAGDGGSAAITENITLFMDNDFEIPAGSKIVVTHLGTAKAYTNSGEPRRFASHQEINLKAFEKWA